MDIFQGNQKLEEVIFTGLNYALYSRHDLNDTFTPFMMLHKNGSFKLVRLVTEGDPMEAFKKNLHNDKESYDQIVLCMEGRVPHEDEKQDVVIVKGYDTSHPSGLLFIQGFRGIESGMPFQKLGNPALVNDREKLPVPLVYRGTNKTVEEPYLSGMVLNDPDGGTSREIFAGHDSASYLANRLFDTVLNILDQNEPDFSGKLRFNFVPNTIRKEPFTQFVFDQLISDLKNHPNVQNWENTHQKNLTIELVFNDEATTPQPDTAPPAVGTPPAPDSSKYATFTRDGLDNEFFRIVSIPNARTNIDCLEAMAGLIAEYEKRGIAMPDTQRIQSYRAATSGKPWWKLW
jgi:hypothetical protein